MSGDHIDSLFTPGDIVPVNLNERLEFDAEVAAYLGNAVFMLEDQDARNVRRSEQEVPLTVGCQFAEDPEILASPNTAFSRIMARTLDATERSALGGPVRTPAMALALTAATVGPAIAVGEAVKPLGGALVGIITSHSFGPSLKESASILYRRQVTLNPRFERKYDQRLKEIEKQVACLGLPPVITRA